MEPRLIPEGYILGLDVGDRRVGVALASTIAKLPQPQNVIDAGHDPIKKIIGIINNEDVKLVVIGIPRNLDGEETAQSRKIREFGKELAGQVDVPLAFVDESLSTKRAEGISENNEFKNVSPDSLAACFILEEYFRELDKIDKEIL